ncbi:MAG: WD40 repeat domain-containing protein, partial [Planctomycetota bacterium]
PQNARLIDTLSRAHRFGMTVCVRFTPDGRTLVSAGPDGILMWDVANRRAAGHLVNMFDASDPAAQARLMEMFSDPRKLRQMMRSFRAMFEGRRVAGDDMSALPFWSALDMSFSQDGRVMAAACSDQCVRIFDMRDRTLLAKLDGHQNLVTSVAISADGRRVVSGSFDRTVRLWNIEQKTEIDRLQGHEDQVMDVGWIEADGSNCVVSAGRDRTLRVWDVSENREIMRLGGHDGALTCLAVSPRGWLGSCAEDGSAQLWRIAPRGVGGVSTAGPDRLVGHSAWVRSLAFSHDGRLLASGSLDGTARLWDVVSHRQVAAITDHVAVVHAVAFSPDGKLLATGSSDRTLRLRDMDAGRPVGAPITWESGIAAMAFSPDGRHIVAGLFNGVVRVHDVLANRPVGQFTGHKSAVLGVAIAPDGKWAATGSEDRTVCIISLPECREMAQLQALDQGVSALAISPDGRWIACGSLDASVRIYNAVTREERLRLEGHEGMTLSLDFSPDGRLLASASRDGTVRLWNVADGRELARLHGDGTARFSPDGALLAVADTDGAIRLCGGGVPEDRELALRITGLQRDTFDLRPISRERERELRKRFATVPDSWYEPDTAAASFWRACHASLRAWTALPRRDATSVLAAMRPLDEWRTQHPDHRLRPMALAMLGAAKDGQDPALLLRDP